MKPIIVSCENPKPALARLRFERELRDSYRCYWKTKDGTAISVIDMTDEHLDNVIAMLERILAERDVVEDNQAEVCK